MGKSFQNDEEVHHRRAVSGSESSPLRTDQEAGSSSSSHRRPEEIARTNILGVGVSAVNLPMAMQAIEHWIEARTPHYVCVAGVHNIMASQHDPALRQIHNRAGLVTPDGMPLVWLSKLTGHRHVDRVYGPDLMAMLCKKSVKKGYRHFLYGSSEEVLNQLSANLSRQAPGLHIAGIYSPPYRPLTPEEDQAIVKRINDCAPDIVWVGLGTPKQDHWMADHVGRLSAPVLVGVGAAFDFHAGAKRQAPYWMQRSGLEWVFRLAIEPRRLWRRYIYNNPRFVLEVFLQLTGLRHYSM
jgi:N-acetylglucosaminyldiphosphoundecaprenol N-acetyl-beta-D-mannosaminyltransferase